jgi:hypothetical protein
LTKAEIEIAKEVWLSGTLRLTLALRKQPNGAPP